MDGSFACPECGNTVEVRGLAPGRNVRCSFCHRLVEVPFLPRVPSSRWKWKRSRFGLGSWVRWAWVGVAVVTVAAATVTGFRLAQRQYRSAQEEQIGRMLASSRDLEAEGRLDEALVELDAALAMMQRSGASSDHPLDEERRHRGDLARREAKAAMERLAADGRDPFPLGEWLNLIARTQGDPDLSPSASQIDEAFRQAVLRRVSGELESAHRASEAGRALAALKVCDRIAALLPRLSREDEPRMRAEAARLVAHLVQARGVAIEAHVADLVAGSESSYRDELIPLLTDGLEAEGYLPYRETSPWKSAWRDAAYHLRLDLSERREGNYMSTENRLTRVAGRLTLTSGGRTIWETTPTARSAVPLPGLPAFLASRVALNRSQELERLLYRDARGQIRGKFAQALSHMPPCCP